MKFRKSMTATMAIVTILSGSAMGQNPQPDDSIVNVNLNEIRVLSNRVPLTSAQTPQQVTILSHEDIKAAPVNTIDDLLKLASGVDVRQRGDGVQTDISLRGGSFDQVTILLNGINISSPHTGHLSADFPISTDDIERIEILEGPSARVFGTQSFCGTINIVTKQSDPSKNGYTTATSGSVNAFAGDHGHYGVNANVTLGHNAGYNSNGTPSRLIHTLSAGYVSDDGDTPNSAYEVKRIFYHAAYKAKSINADIQAGYSYKPYEANTFYGAASKDQWESNEHFLVAANADITAGKIHILPMLSADRRYDHYQWHKNSNVGENFHRCDVRTVGLNAWTESSFGRSSLGVEVRSEQIYSTKLGEMMDQSDFFATLGHDGTKDVNYTHLGERTNIIITAEHVFLWDKWTVALAVPTVLNTDLDNNWRWCPGTDIAYRPNKSWKIFMNVNSALRMPSFTDLYYSGKNIEGNSDLNPERTIDYSTGAKYRKTGFSTELRLFGSNKTDMIDWVIYADEPDGETYRSGNFKMKTLGTELDFNFLPREIWENSYLKKITLQYSYIDADITYKQQIIASKYAQEYLKHKIAASADVKIVKDLTFSATYRYQYRTGENNDPYSLVDCGLKYNWNKFSIYGNVSNLFDEKYTDFSYIEQPGRRFIIGAKFSF